MMQPIELTQEYIEEVLVYHLYGDYRGHDFIEGEGHRPFRGDDELNGSHGNDFIDGGSSYSDKYAPDYWVHGGMERGFNSDNDYLNGGIGNDVLIGGHGNDVLVGHNNNDVLVGDSIEIRVTGGGYPINRSTRPSTEPATFYGDGNDVLYGSSGDDYLHGGGGTNILNGGAGNDTLVSEGDNDVLTGGPGEDFFWVTNNASGIVKIMDFEDGVDKIVVDRDAASWELYANAWRGGITLGMDHFATDLEGADMEDGVLILIDEGVNLMVNGVDSASLGWDLAGATADYVFIA